MLKTHKNLIVASEQIQTWRRGLAEFQGTVISPEGEENGACFDISGQRTNFILYTAPFQNSKGFLTGSLYIRTSEAENATVGLRVENRLVEGTSSFHTVGRSWQRITTTHYSDRSIYPTLILFNPPGSDPISVCAWGAQMEQGPKATKYVPIVESVLSSFSVNLTERLLKLLILGISILGLVLLLALGTYLWNVSPKAFGWGFLAVYLTQIGFALFQRSPFLGQTIERASGFSFHPNVFASQLLVLGSFLCFTTNKRYLRSIIISVGIVGVWTSGSRAAFLIAVFGVLMALLVKVLKERRWLYVDFFRISVFLILAIGLTYLNERFTLSSLSSLISDPRTDILPAAWSLFLQRPIVGWGANVSDKLLLLELWDTDPEFYAHTHNLFAEIAVSYGVIGLICSITLLLTFILNALRDERTEVLIPLILITIMNLFDYTLSQPMVYIPTILLLASLDFSYYKNTVKEL